MNIVFFNYSFWSTQKTHNKLLTQIKQSHRKKLIYCFMSNTQNTQDEGPACSTSAGYRTSKNQFC